jgi:hypothetical protein
MTIAVYQTIFGIPPALPLPTEKGRFTVCPDDDCEGAASVKFGSGIPTMSSPLFAREKDDKRDCADSQQDQSLL